MALLESDAYDGAKGSIGHTSPINGSNPNLSVAVKSIKSNYNTGSERASGTGFGNIKFVNPSGSSKGPR
jgi:hypothetical protein